jgi:hypothetical protein
MPGVKGVGGDIGELGRRRAPVEQEQARPQVERRRRESPTAEVPTPHGRAPPAEAASEPPAGATDTRDERPQGTWCPRG